MKINILFIFFLLPKICLTAAVESKKKAEKTEMRMVFCKKELFKRLNEDGFGDFLEKTNLDEMLSGEPKVSSCILIIIKLALHNFSQIGNPLLTGILLGRKNRLIEILLKDYPDEIEEFKKQLEEFDPEEPLYNLI